MATEIHTKKAAEVLVAGVDFTPRLIDGDTLTGTPSVAVSPSGLTINDPQRNAAPVTILLAQVPADQAVLATVSGGTPGTTYTLTVTVATTSGQTLQEDLFVKVRA